MKIAFYLAHPAHYHLFKNVVNSIKSNYTDIEIVILYNEKDVLEELLNEQTDWNIVKIKTKSKGGSSFSLKRQFIQKFFGTYKVLQKLKPDAVIGTSIIISLISKILAFKSIIVNEDDFDIIKKTSNFGYPFTYKIICPNVCRTGKFYKKCITYDGYHELAYLHPDIFTSQIEIAHKYIDVNSPFCILRFAKLTAHHDTNIKGITNDFALKIIERLSKYGIKTYITSERFLDERLFPYKLSIPAKDIHNVLAFAAIFIGDSQTMAAESAVLGVPFIRYNDFVGRISYLDELENHFELGYGIKPDNENKLLSTIDVIFTESKEIYQEKRNQMLNQKINVKDFLVTTIINLVREK
jgi:uncharacterized protein